MLTPVPGELDIAAASLYYDTGEVAKEHSHVHTRQAPTKHTYPPFMAEAHPHHRCSSPPPRSRVCLHQCFRRESLGCPLLHAPTHFTYTGHSSYVSAVAWSPGGTRIASASGEGTVQVWDALT